MQEYEFTVTPKRGRIVETGEVIAHLEALGFLLINVTNCEDRPGPYSAYKFKLLAPPSFKPVND